MTRINETAAAKALQSAVPLSGAPFLLHVGNDAWYKNRSGLLRIFSSFRKRFGKPVRLVLVGPLLNQEQRSFATGKGFIDDVVLVESASDEVLRALYSSALALIFPSLYEGFGWPPLEAQACGCPVVASPLGSLSEILQDGGILIDPENKEGYAEAIDRLATDDEYRDKEIKRGYLNVKRFDAQKSVTEYLTVYEQVIQSQSSSQ